MAVGGVSHSVRNLGIHMHTNRNLFWLLLTPASGKGRVVEEDVEVTDRIPHVQKVYSSTGTHFLGMHLPTFYRPV